MRLQTPLILKHSKRLGVFYMQKSLKFLCDKLDISINCSWVVTRWQNTFTHKQYIEQHKQQPNNTKTN
jgi:hypothetical protein